MCLLKIVSKTSIKSGLQSMFTPSRHTIKFYEDHLEVYGKSLLKSLNYADINEVTKMKT